MVRIAIVAGGGSLPRNLAIACKDLGMEVFILALRDNTDPEVVAGFPNRWIKIGEVKRGIEILNEENVQKVVFAGPVRRPTFKELSLDVWAFKKAAQLGIAWLGDNSILSSLVCVLEEEGFEVIGADEILATSLVDARCYGKYSPTKKLWEDIRHGMFVARGIGKLDIGQAAVVQQGIVLGVEGIDGTDPLIQRCSNLRRSGTGPVLVKACKPQQERRIDLPTIGLNTIKLLQENGFSGVAVEAGASLILEISKLTELANSSGLFVIGVD